MIVRIYVIPDHARLGRILWEKYNQSSALKTPDNQTFVNNMTLSNGCIESVHGPYKNVHTFKSKTS